MKDQMASKKVKEMGAQLMLDPNQREEVNRVCAEKGPIDKTLDTNELLAFDQFLKIYAMTIALEVRLLK